MQEFIEKEFYIEPPSSDATPEVWEKWMVAEKRKRAAHKRAYTMSQDHAEAPDSMRETTQRKVGGVWRQSVCLGIGGTEEDGYTLEPTEDAQQNREMILARWEKAKRGTKSRGRHARRKKNKHK